MFRFGIQNYRPQWLNGRDVIAAAHGSRLAALTGRTLRQVWLVWDLIGDEWFTDAPVLLDFDGEQLEVDHQKFDDVSITWNTLDPTQEIDNVADSCFHLAWRPGPQPQLAGLAGRTLHHVELLEWIGNGYRDMAAGSISLGFDFAPAWLTIYNALDENGLEHAGPGPEYRRHLLSL
jgi:hypothetical protein